MKRLPILLTLLTLVGCAHEDPWTRKDTAYELAYVVAISADAYSTSQIQYHKNIIEKQPITHAILGNNPSTSGTWQYFASIALTHYLISRALPQKYRRWWQVGGATYHSYFILNNCNIELCRNNRTEQ